MEVKVEVVYLSWSMLPVQSSNILVSSALRDSIIWLGDHRGIRFDGGLWDQAKIDMQHGVGTVFCLARISTYIQQSRIMFASVVSQQEKA